MDKKNTTIGILFIAAALVVMVAGPRIWKQPPPAPETTSPESGAPSTSTTPAPAGAPPETSILPGSGEPVPVATPAEAKPAGIVSSPANPLFAVATSGAVDSELVSLSNDFIDVRFSPMGGAIAEIALKKYPTERDGDLPYLINGRRVAPALGILNFPGADRGARYEVVEQTANSISWRTTIAGRLEVTRTYSIHPDQAAGEPYLIRHQTTFRNLSDQSLATPALAFNLGVAEPAHPGDLTGLNVSACREKDVELAGPGNFESGWFARMFGQAKPPQAVVTLDTVDIEWAAVKNQFFTTVLMPETPSGRIQAQRVALTGDPSGPIGMTGSWITGPLTLPREQPVSVAMEFFAGPKEYKRLNALDRNQYLIMEWGSFIGIFAAVLFKLMNFLHGLLAGSDWAWGWAIIATTVIIRSLMWPITAQAARSAKRMAKIQGPLKAIQEKYKDNRVKQQEETIKLFREHKINPVGGCLPLLFQFPIFLGLFSMLRSASELRFADFLWIHDLSMADTVARIGGIPINPMPLLMGATMFFQMRMTPTPTTDNASAKMMKFMPIFVTVMCYGFSSGLAVYWTASNCFSIFQQWVTNRRKDAEPSTPVTTGNADRAKPVRDAKVTNVTKKKK